MKIKTHFGDISLRFHYSDNRRTTGVSIRFSDGSIIGACIKRFHRDAPLPVEQVRKLVLTRLLHQSFGGRDNRQFRKEIWAGYLFQVRAIPGKTLEQQRELCKKEL